jgi:hypothetical protein
MEIPVKIVSFGDPKLRNFSPWRWKRKSRLKRFGDEVSISFSARGYSVLKNY